MILKVFAVYDSKAGAFLAPFFSINVATASRDFMAAATDGGHQFCRYPGDYELFLLGEWDQYEGVIKMYETKQTLGLASQFISKAGNVVAMREER